MDHVAFFALLLFLFCYSARGVPLPLIQSQAPSPLVVSSSLRKLSGPMKAASLDHLAFFALLPLFCYSARSFPLPFIQFQVPSLLVVSSSLRKLPGPMKATNLDHLAFFALLLLFCYSARSFPLPFIRFQVPSPLVGPPISFRVAVSAYYVEILTILWLSVRV